MYLSGSVRQKLDRISFKMFGNLFIRVALATFFWNEAMAIEDARNTSLPSCKIKNSNINECLKTFLQDAIKHSQQGSKKYSIPPLDPYFVPKIVMASSKNMGVNIEMKNSTTSGFSKAILTRVKADPVKGLFEIHYIVPVSTILSHYSLNGKIFNMPINGQGNSNITFFDTLHEVKIKGDVREKNETNHKDFVLSSVTMRLKPKRMKFQFEKLFKENKELGDMINQMMNDNWKDIFARLQPKLEEDMSKHSYKLMSDFSRAVSYDQIFPDVP